MQLTMTRTAWTTEEPGPGLREAAAIMADSIWRDAATAYHIEYEAKAALRKSTPKGVQPHLNRILDEKFAAAGWDVHLGRFAKGDTWVRVSFRHKMSLGSDFIDAQVAAKKGGARQLVICAATQEFLRTISPNDAAGLVSYERLVGQAAILRGVFDFPLFLGRLTPLSPLPQDVAKGLQRSRPRDIYAPAE